MKRVKYLIIITLIPLIGFAQLFSRGETMNNESFTTKAKELESFNDSIKKTTFHWDVSIGTFIPTNNAKFLGVKPTLGASVGIIHKRMTYDFTFDIRFGRTNKEYQLANGEMTDYYFGGYMGIDVLGEVWSNNKNQILILGGIGLDVFDIVPGDYEDPKWWEVLFFGEESYKVKDGVSIFTPNINLGAMYRYYFKGKNYVGIRYRYNIVNYNSNKIRTNVTGNFHSITLSFGGGILGN